jgi:hypothetical protein
MTLPGFNAETSLYRTSVHYRLMGSSVHANGFMPQQAFARCGPCYRNWQINPNTGACVRDCTQNVLICPFGFGGGCFTPTWTEPCSESDCPVAGGIPVGAGNGGTGGGHGVAHS